MPHNGALVLADEMKKLFIIFLLAIVWLQYRLWSPDGGISEWLRLQNELALAQGHIKQLESSNESLKNLVLDLQNHTDAIETQAREVLHFAMPNETFFRVISVPSQKAESYVPNLPRTKLSMPEKEGSIADIAAEAPP
jgi:cell division protein FtsB